MTSNRIPACTLADLRRDHVRVVSLAGRTIAVFEDAGRVYAVDNRCPHMGFPLHRGSVRNGILTCHWHHAKFDLVSGCTFDPFADDVAAFQVEVRDGDVWIDPRPSEEELVVHWRRKLDEGLQQNIALVLAKSVIGLDGLDSKDILARAALFGVRNRTGGWSTGLSSLTALANVLPSLDPADRPRALYHGLLDVADSTAGQPPHFALAPFSSTERNAGRYTEWFRNAVEMRSSTGAEKTLRTAVHVGLPPKDIEQMLFAAATDHRYIDGGHTLDFINKAFELLGHIGWEHAEDVLASLVPSLTQAQREEETAAWREPVDLGQVLDDAYVEMDSVLPKRGKGAGAWRGQRDLAARLLDGDPGQIVEALLDALRQGAALTDLSATVAYAAALRVAQFHTSNDFFDWNTVHHAFTYANAVDQAMRRSPSPLLARAVFDGAIAVYLARFLNVPRAPLPTPLEHAVAEGELLACFDRQGQVDETAQMVADMFERDRRSTTALLGRALLREDAGFHQIQIYEAAVQQSARYGAMPEARNILVAAARFLTAHAPTARTADQTYQVAARLHRGETLHGAE